MGTDIGSWGCRAAYVGGLPLAVVTVTENDPLGECARGARGPAWDGRRAAATVGFCSGHDARRLHLAAARCGVGVVAGQGRSSGSAINPGQLLTFLEASRDARHPIAASQAHHESDAPGAGHANYLRLGRCHWRRRSVHDRAHASPSAACTTPGLMDAGVIHIRAPREPGRRRRGPGAAAGSSHSLTLRMHGARSRTARPWR